MNYNKENEPDEPKEADLSEADCDEIRKYFEFMKSAKEAREGQPPDTPIEFKCPICGGKAITSYLSYNGHPSGRCECGISFMV